MVINIVKENCDAIYEKLAPIYLTTPSIQEDWLKIASDFEELWNLLNVVGVLDGKHIRIKCLAVSRIKFYNYKGFTV